ncbi:amidase family protein, partial [Mycobacterium tuberculosis]|uniref:amidase family protein n=1 Tax=Mycobacterium tuberculosis TaxID=1773 RepID=UPI0022352EC4
PAGRTRGCLLRSTPETSRRLRSQIRESPDSPGRFNRLGRTIDVDGVSRSYWDQLKWNALANIAGTPATTMPITTTATGLPIGIQAMGPAGGDRTTVEFAALLTEVLGGFRVPPL